MWSARTNVLPGATEIISESFRKYLSNLPGKHTKELKEPAILGIAHLRENSCKGTKHSAWEITLPYHKLLLEDSRNTVP